MKYFKAVLALMLIVFICTPAICMEISEEGQKDDLVLRASVPKQSFCPNEPIFVKVTLTNKSKESRFLAEATTAYWIIGCRLKPISNHTVLTPSHAEYTAPTKECASTFGPGESRTTILNVLTNYDRTLPDGEYDLIITYHPPTSLPDITQTRIETFPVRISITSKTAEAQAWEALHEARNGIYTLSSAKIKAEELKQLGSKYRVIAPYALYLESVCYQTLKDSNKELETLENFIKLYPDIPLYSDGISARIGKLLYEKGEHQKALSIIDKLPDSYNWRDYKKTYKQKIANAMKESHGSAQPQ